MSHASCSERFSPSVLKVLHQNLASTVVCIGSTLRYDVQYLVPSAVQEEGSDHAGSEYLLYVS